MLTILSLLSISGMFGTVIYNARLANQLEQEEIEFNDRMKKMY